MALCVARAKTLARKSISPSNLCVTCNDSVAHRSFSLGRPWCVRATDSTPDAACAGRRTNCKVRRRLAPRRAPVVATVLRIGFGRTTPTQSDVASAMHAQLGPASAISGSVAPTQTRRSRGAMDPGQILKRRHSAPRSGRPTAQWIPAGRAVLGPAPSRWWLLRRPPSQGHGSVLAHAFSAQKQAWPRLPTVATAPARPRR